MKNTNILEGKSSFIEMEQYQKKIATLVSYASKIRFNTIKELKKTDSWHSRISEVRNKLGKHFKFLFIEVFPEQGQPYVRPMMVQEFDQYDSFACNKTVGQVLLPIKKVGDKVFAAITSYAPVGAYGKVMFGAIRFSNSKEKKSVFSECTDVIYRKFQRQDFERLTGQVETKVVNVDDKMLENVNDEKEKIVWFDLNELAVLLEDERFQDSMSITLIQSLLSNYSNRKTGV